ncbi:four F5 protein [Microstroma glucosiphilum]|uniref:Four F5 protein n=1 Tax=Pseudomicrostroma glucosiphilum TaxID=1684307 RepID=A0A316U9K1_9BASI|nr:four F5 protein [Pseudomicrostroma glucosiphilum]PWN21886.1 four F5 protein [Pseudomicrostroma glucosiphilum]
MTRGNQRDTDRAKAQKKAAAANKGKKESGVSLTARRERDAQIIRDKQAKKEAEKEAAAKAGQTS